MSKKICSTAAAGSNSGGDRYLERLPDCVINEILLKLEVETLCTIACVSKSFRSAVSHILSSQSSLDLSGFSPDPNCMNQIGLRLEKFKCVILDCLRLDDYTVCTFLGPHIEELSLLKCSSLSYEVLGSIAKHCPTLRKLVLELSGCGIPELFQKNLVQLCEGCQLLESVCIKIRDTKITEINARGFMNFASLSKRLIFLKLQPVLECDALFNLRFHELAPANIASFPSSPRLPLKCLSLVLDVITDLLVIAIVSRFPLLVVLALEDRPKYQPTSPHDLTNVGLAVLEHCKHLTSLSLIRSRKNHNAHFKEIDDVGMFLLSEGCKGLESIKLGGFSRVGDAGFASILNSCQNLKKIEIYDAALLSDVAFHHDLSKVNSNLVKVRLMSCSNITSESVEELASSKVLEVLDLLGCKSVADSCLGPISCGYALTYLNLSGADVTDSGMNILGKGSSPITYLSLRGCKRLTDRGIGHLLQSGGKISKTLSSLDLGHMPGISDRAILIIASYAPAITELCIRYCFYVTDFSVKALGSADRKRYAFLRKLDLLHCTGLSAESLEYLKKPYFPGLRWIGVGLTCWVSKGNDALAQIYGERPLLTGCSDGCEMGCHDGWEYHQFDRL